MIPPVVEEPLFEAPLPIEATDCDRLDRDFEMCDKEPDENVLRLDDEERLASECERLDRDEAREDNEPLWLAADEPTWLAWLCTDLFVDATDDSDDVDATDDVDAWLWLAWLCTDWLIEAKDAEILVNEAEADAEAMPDADLDAADPDPEPFDADPDNTCDKLDRDAERLPATEDRLFPLERKAEILFREALIELSDDPDEEDEPQQQPGV